MRKADLKVGMLCEAIRPGSLHRGRRGVKVSVVEIGLRRPGYKALDGVLVRLEEQFAEHDPFSDSVEIRLVGYTYLVRTKDVMAPWNEQRERWKVEREERDAQAIRVEASLLSLGLRPSVAARRELVIGRTLVEEGQSGRGGYRVMGAKRSVAIDLSALEVWLEQINPSVVADQAIREFVEVVCADDPHRGLGDMDRAELDVWCDTTVERVTARLVTPVAG